MKKILGLFALLLLLTGCDDGDMTFKTFNFSDGTTAACTDNSLIYKVQGTEALLLQLDPTAFTQVATNGTPRIITLGSGNGMIYRTYSGTVSGSSICAVIPPASPSVIEEYVAQAGGTLSIETVAVLDTDGRITGYNHTITIINATFSRDGETIIITNNLFGVYNIPVSYRFDFLDENSDASIQKCEGAFTGRSFKTNGDEALLLNLTPETFPNVVGTTTIDLANTTDGRDIIFNEYNGTALATLFCNVVPPITPIVTDQWEAVLGQLRIETDIVGGANEHVFFLDNVTFINRQVNAEQFTINVTGGYRLGKLTIAN